MPQTPSEGVFRMCEQLTLFSIPNQDLPESSNEIYQSQKKLHRASRQQVEMMFSSLDEMIPVDHPVRAVWSYVEKLDLSKALDKIASYDGDTGRSAIDPKILVALWLYATVEGIGSARVLARYVHEHMAFRWICGNVEIGRKTISDFRVKHSDLFDDMLAQGVAILVQAEQVSLKEIAQDGLRVRANASKNSFHRKKTIEQQYQEAKERVADLKKEIQEDPNKCTNREKVNRQRIADERLKRLEAAQVNLQKVLDTTAENRQKHKKKGLTEEEKKELRVSTTDPDARKMKMPDGSFHPAYNFQFAATTDATVIVGVSVVQAGTDGGQMLPMYHQIKERYQIIPEKYLADGGFKNKSDVEAITRDGCKIYLPLQEKYSGEKVKDMHEVRANESKEVGQWRSRMREEESKIIYKKRSKTIELVNARLRRHGLYRLCVRGLDKARSIAKMFAVTHNMLRSFSLGAV